MKRHRTLIASPLEWQMAAVPVPHPVIPVLAERGGTQIKAPRGVVVVDTREQDPFDFSRFEGWFAGIEHRALKLGDYRTSVGTTPSRQHNFYRLRVFPPKGITSVWARHASKIGPLAPL